MSDFKTAAEVLTNIYQAQLANQPVQENRARVNLLFNGDPPWTEAERQQNRIFTNVNWLEPQRIAMNANSQLHNAFFKPGNFFQIKLDTGDPAKRQAWGKTITKCINRALKRSKEFREAVKAAFAQLVLHGPGPLVWKDKESPIPTEIGVEDVIVPAGTLASMRNLDSLALYREMTWFELWEMTHGPSVDKGWNMKFVDAIINNLQKQPLQPLYQANRWLFPEKLGEDWKENAGLLASASLPKCLVWDFYYRNHKTAKWDRCMVLDYNQMFVGGDDRLRESMKESYQRDYKQLNQADDFLYQKDNYCDSWQQIIHWFVGNCSNVAPFRYYSIRSIGYLMYAVGLTQNRLRSRFTDALFESLMWYFRNVGEDDRERLEKIDLHHLGIIPDGLSWVPSQERHTINENLVLVGLNQGRQLMAESSSSFVPDVSAEGKNGPEMTATEALIRNNASVTLTSAVLNQTYEQAEPFYREICRRFCIKGNSNELVKEVLENIRKEGVPDDVMDVEYWEIIPDRVMGGGNKSVELQTARALLEITPKLDPESQRYVLREYITAISDDPMEADMLVPQTGPVATEATHYANLLFATLMQGIPEAAPRSDISNIEYIAAMLQQMELCMQQIEPLAQQPDGLPSAAEKIFGLFNVSANIEQHIRILATDPSQKELIKAFAEKLQELGNILRQMAQKIQELEQEKAAQQNNGQPQVDPVTQSKIAGNMAIAQSKMQINQANAAQKAGLKDAAWQEEQRRRNADAVAEIQRKAAITQADGVAKLAQTHSNIVADHLTTQADISRKDKETEAASTE